MPLTLPHALASCGNRRELPGFCRARELIGQASDKAPGTTAKRKTETSEWNAETRYARREDHRRASNRQRVRSRSLIFPDRRGLIRFSRRENRTVRYARSSVRLGWHAAEFLRSGSPRLSLHVSRSGHQLDRARISAALLPQLAARLSRRAASALPMDRSRRPLDPRLQTGKSSATCRRAPRRSASRTKI
jgi:hypothetical protein